MSQPTLPPAVDSPTGDSAVNLAAMRENYTLGSLSEQDVPAQPEALFDQWLQQAMQHPVPEPNAMTLATVGSDLRPSTRIVLLKARDARGLVWFTNYQSRKAVELAGNPHAALQFHWVELQRTVRIEGVVEKTSEGDSDAYFQQRPLASRIGAWVSPQSRAIPNRATLDNAFAQFEAELAEAGGPESPARPPFWGGYRLLPQRWEFWQGRVGRLHDRLAYQRTEQGWDLGRLAP